jgi:hypothetical protein
MPASHPAPNMLCSIVKEEKLVEDATVSAQLDGPFAEPPVVVVGFEGAGAGRQRAHEAAAKARDERLGDQHAA